MACGDDAMLLLQPPHLQVNNTQWTAGATEARLCVHMYIFHALLRSYKFKESWQCVKSTRPTLLGVAGLLSKQDVRDVLCAEVCGRNNVMKETHPGLEGMGSPGCAALHSFSRFAVQ